MIDKYLELGLPLFAFKLPNEKVINFALINEVKSVDFESLKFLSGNSFVMFPFDTNKSNGWAFSVKSIEKSEIKPFSQNSNYVFDKSLKSFSSSEFEKYKSQFSLMMSELQKGAVDKVILSKVVETTKKSDLSVGEIFNRLSSKYQSTFVFLVSTKETSLWMGASPELLFSKNGDICKTVSLAGTRSPEDSAEKWTDKEREEQGMVTTFIDEVLRKYNIDDYQKDSAQIVNVGTVSHLKTSYQFQINSSISWNNIVQDLHPTPALCGEPKAKAMSLIEKVEPHNREFYGGFVGFIDKDVNLYVNLRSMKVEDNDLKIFVGGGLTKKSNLEDEWNELQLKSQILLSIL